MKNFLYLRIVVLITLVCVISIMLFLLYRWSRYLYWDLWFIISEILMIFFVGHCASVLYIHHRCYPDKELSRATDLFYRITSYGCGTICFLFLIGLFVLMSNGETEKDKNTWFVIIPGALFIALFAVQLYGGKQLFRTIRQNARAQLENSFA